MCVLTYYTDDGFRLCFVNEFTENISTFTENISTFTENISTFTGNIITFTGNISTFTGNITTCIHDLITHALRVKFSCPGIIGKKLKLGIFSPFSTPQL